MRKPDGDDELGGAVLDAEDVVVVAGHEQAEREQQGVAREEREEEPALDEDDADGHPDEGAAELGQQPVRVEVLDAQQHRLHDRGEAHARQTYRGSCSGVR